jgi:hypothetical protein
VFLQLVWRFVRSQVELVLHAIFNASGGWVGKSCKLVEGDSAVLFSSSSCWGMFFKIEWGVVACPCHVISGV